MSSIVAILDGPEVIEDAPHAEPTFQQSLHALACTNLYFNILGGICIPLGIALGCLEISDTATFAVNMGAIVALAKMLDLATDQVSGRLGQAMGALINCSFVGIIALRKDLLQVVQSSLIGSILSNLLFVLGWCFFLGGLKYPTQKFNAHASNTGASLFILSLFGFMLPAVFAIAPSNGSAPDLSKILLLSRGTAILLILTYAAFLFFQLVTHKEYYQAPEDAEEEEHLITLNVAVATLIVSTGSSMQISMFVAPLLVIVGWIINVPLSLSFPLIDVTVLFVTILVVNHTLSDAESNWLEGFMLLIGYLVIALVYAMLPDPPILK